MGADTVGEVDVAFDRITEQQTVRPLLATLPERERTILYLRFFQSPTQGQIAEHLGVSQMPVSRLPRRALHTLREQL